jgi:hypothetical protein
VRYALIHTARAVGGAHFTGRVRRDKFNQYRRYDRKGAARRAVEMIARIDAPGVPDGPVGVQRPLRIGRVGGEPVSDMPLDLGDWRSRRSAPVRRRSRIRSSSDADALRPGPFQHLI